MSCHFNLISYRTLFVTRTSTPLTIFLLQVVVGDVTHGGTFGRVHEGICRHPDSGLSQPVIVKTVSGEFNFFLPIYQC